MDSCGLPIKDLPAPPDRFVTALRTLGAVDYHVDTKYPADAPFETLPVMVFRSAGWIWWKSWLVDGVFRGPCTGLRAAFRSKAEYYEDIDGSKMYDALCVDDAGGLAAVYRWDYYDEDGVLTYFAHRVGAARADRGDRRLPLSYRELFAKGTLILFSVDRCILPGEDD